MTPKVVYTLNGEAKTIVFAPEDYTLLTQEWERDEIEYKNPFTGVKTRKVRGYYYKATLAFDAIPYDLIDDYRDLFNINTMEIKFYPSVDTVEFYECDVNENISTEDASALDAYRNVELVFRSKARYDSALNYPSLYWGARRTIFNDSGTMETHRAELNAADASNRDDYNTVEADAQQHRTDGHPALYYLKEEIDEASDAGALCLYSFAGYAYPGEDHIANNAGLFGETQAGLPHVIASDGTITKISARTEQANVNAIVSIAVARGQILSLATTWAPNQDTYEMRLSLRLDGVEKWPSGILGTTQSLDVTVSFSLSALQVA